MIDYKNVDLLNEILNILKSRFIGKDDIIDLIGIALVARENIFLFGPPGTAKSAIIHQLSELIKGKTFEYLLTRFTEPNEIFGPFDIRKLREGELITNTTGMLPEADLIFLDELLNANSAILNSLLMVLNEKVFKRGSEKRDLPVLMTVGASNNLPEDESLQALFDRFLIRVNSTYVDSNLLGDVLSAGWSLEKKQLIETQTISVQDILLLQSMVTSVNLDSIRPRYIELVQKLRNAGVKVSDRRAVKLQRLISASALLCKREKAIISDMWVLKYIWDTENQIEIIASIVDNVLKDHKDNQAHTRAFISTTPNPDEIYNEIKLITEKWDKALDSEKSSLKDRLRYLTNRSDWISNENQREYVQKEIDNLWKKIVKDE